jgi:copper chaperone CopZ
MKTPLSTLRSALSASVVPTASLAFLVAVPVSFANSAAVPADAKPTLTLTQAGAQAATLAVTGMSCASCERAITASLKKLDGVQTVAFRKGKDSQGVRTVVVTYAPGAQVTTAQLVQAVEAAGYHASVK